jgi:hypothetical protein
MVGALVGKIYSTGTFGGSLPDQLSASFLTHSKFPDAFHTDDRFWGDETIDGKVVEVKPFPRRFGVVSLINVQTSEGKREIVCPLSLETVVLDGQMVKCSGKGLKSYSPFSENQAYTNYPVNYTLEVASGENKGKVFAWTTEHHEVDQDDD